MILLSYLMKKKMILNRESTWAGSRKQGTGSRKQVTGSRKQVASHKDAGNCSL